MTETSHDYPNSQKAKLKKHQGKKTTHDLASTNLVVQQVIKYRIFHHYMHDKKEIFQKKMINFVK